MPVYNSFTTKRNTAFVGVRHAWLYNPTGQLFSMQVITDRNIRIWPVMVYLRVGGQIDMGVAHMKVLAVLSSGKRCH